MFPLPSDGLQATAIALCLTSLTEPLMNIENFRAVLARKLVLEQRDTEQGVA